MKVLSVNKYHRAKGGSETIFLGEMDLLRAQGHEVIPFSMKEENSLPSDYSKFFVDNVDYEKPGLKNKIIASSKILYSFDARNKMAMLLKQEPVDIAHLHLFQHQISPSIFAPLQQRNIPIVATLHDLKPICGNYKMYVDGAVCERCKGGKHFNMLRYRCNKGSLAGSLVNTVEMYLHHIAGFYRQIDTFIAVSHFYRQKLIEFGFDAEKIAYLPSYVAVDEHGVADKVSNYALYFGRLSDEKGVDVFVEAASLNPDIPHYIVGTGPDEPQLRAEVARRNIKNVVFHGFQSGAALKQLICEALMIVVPSRWYENSPLTVLEGFAHGRPIIGADIGGIPELIDPNVDGLLFEPANASALAIQIATLAKDPDLASDMGARGREKVRQHFNADAHLKGLLDIYAKAGTATA